MQDRKNRLVATTGKIDDLDRSFDIWFWQEQGPDAIFEQAWRLVIQKAEIEGIDESQLRLQRSVCRVQQAPD